jgi:hypothetical protein
MPPSPTVDNGVSGAIATRSGCTGGNGARILSLDTTDPTAKKAFGVISPKAPTEPLAFAFAAGILEGDRNGRGGGPILASRLRTMLPDANGAGVRDSAASPSGTTSPATAARRGGDGGIGVLARGRGGGAGRLRGGGGTAGCHGSDGADVLDDASKVIRFVEPRGHGEPHNPLWTTSIPKRISMMLEVSGPIQRTRINKCRGYFSEAESQR